MLLDFVLWRLRSRDLPPDVQAAAVRLSRGITRPGYLQGVIRHTDGPLHVDGFPKDDAAPLDRRKAFPHNVGQVIRDQLSRGCRYVLVQEL